MTSVRQTVTSVQTHHSGHAGVGQLDNNLDALLEDLQTSVSRPGSSTAMNGMSGGDLHPTYHQVTRTVEHNKVCDSPVLLPSGYHHVTRTMEHENVVPARDVQVQYLSAANPITVVAERANSPNANDILQMQQQAAGQQLSSYKTVSYQYNTQESQPGVAGGVMDGETSSASDLRLHQNLTELDSLLIDLHQAQKTGFSPDQSGAGVASVRGIDPGLLEPVDLGTPNLSARQQHTSRTVHRYHTLESPRLQPKRSSSAQRELVYGTIEQGHTRPRTRSPSPASPRVPQRSAVQKEWYYESKTNRDKSPANRQLRREVYYEQNKPVIMPEPRGSTTVHTYNYSDGSPCMGSELLPARSASPSGGNYPPTKVTTVRTYNYSDGSPRMGPELLPARSPSPSGGSYPSTKVTTLRTHNYSDGSPRMGPELLPARSPSPSGGSYPPTKVTTTVRTYTYQLPGQPNQPYPAKPDSDDLGSDDCTLTYQVSPQREKEPLMAVQAPQPPKQASLPLAEPTVITYKYSAHSSHSTSTKFPGQPVEDQQPLLPRPFPTTSPSATPGDSQPPKRLDDLMASFSDPENRDNISSPYYTSEKQTASPPGRGPNPEVNGGVVMSPILVAKPNADMKDRTKTKNVAGPPVYYPPGVELFAKKEEQAGQYQEGGGMWKASGQYEASRESKSKSSSSGGAVMVPVCLPLCCGMPCVIM